MSSFEIVFATRPPFELFKKTEAQQIVFDLITVGRFLLPPILFTLLIVTTRCQHASVPSPHLPDGKERVLLKLEGRTPRQVTVPHQPQVCVGSTRPDTAVL